MPLQVFGDVAVDPKNVYLVSKRIVPCHSYSAGDKEALESNECSIVLQDARTEQSFCVIPISTAAADALLKHFANDPDQTAAASDRPFLPDETGGSSASDCSP